MIYKVSGVEIELTSRCNASCPQCSRNYYGGETWPTLPLVDLSFDLIKTKLGKLIKNLSHVKLCGTYGDPCVHPKLIEIVQWIVDNSDCEITINTNGSLRTKKWWNTLAKTLGSRGRVFFGIDGLEDTHHLYRIDTSYNKIIENLKTFNQAGGRSVWSFLIFEHNQHQVDECEQLARDMGFKWFRAKVSKRPLINRLEAPIGWQLTAEKTGPIKCHVLNEKSAYIDAQGRISPCCWLGFYPKTFGHGEYHQAINAQISN